MLNIPQTSLIPSVIALSDFFIKNFPDFSWYPNWYLGNPFNFLIGPVIPISLWIFKSLLRLDTTTGYFILMFLAVIFGSLGVYKLTKRLGAEKRQSILAQVLFLTLPLSYFLLSFSSGLQMIALSVSIWIFYQFCNFLTKNNLKNDLYLYILVVFAVLINISSLLTILIGLICLFLTIEVKKSLRVYLIFKIILLICLALVTISFWYTSEVWWAILKNPSLSGKPLFSLIKLIFSFLFNLLPIIIALWVVKLKKIKLSFLSKFSLFFLTAFGFLSLFRFISDPDFLIDWISFTSEIQFGLALILSSFFAKDRVKKWGLLALVLVFGLSVLIYFQIFKTWTDSKNLTYQKDILGLLKDVPANQRIFTSGSAVFWLNSKLNLMQLRGGVDEASVHPFWRHAAYQIREEADGDLSKKWLEALGTNFILVNQEESREYFKDFRFIDKFKNWQTIGNKQGDFIFKLDSGNLVRIADKSLLNLKPPKDGSDNIRVNQYVSKLKDNLHQVVLRPNQIEIEADLDKSKIISLAITYHPGWDIVSGQGKLTSDSLGNMVLIPKQTGKQNYLLKFQLFRVSWLIPLMFLFLILFVVFVFYDYFYPLLTKILRKSSVDTEDY
ncbi:hypothetical protein HYS93_01340 [Candidatus Daviesbacteria bacterium]|nr:hypothetical protein [Candidatus Daviesbacteria bacterium]